MWAIRPKPQLSLNSSGRYKPAFIGTLTEHAPAGTKVSFQFRSATNAQEKAPDFQNRSKGLTFCTPSRSCQIPLATDRPHPDSHRASRDGAGSASVQLLLDDPEALRPRLVGTDLLGQRGDRRLRRLTTGEAAVGHHVEGRTLMRLSVVPIARAVRGNERPGPLLGS